MTQSDGLTGAQKVATLLLGIDMALAAKVLKYMGEDQVELVTRAMKELEEVAIETNDLRNVFREGFKRMHGAGFALGDVHGVIKTVLKKAFGDNRGEELISNMEQNILAQKPFAVFETIPAEDLASLLADEHPQIVAVFLAHLDSSKAGQVVAQIDEEIRPDIMTRIATLGRSSPEVVQRVVDVLRQKVKDLGLSTRRSEPKHWIKRAASILNNMGGAAEKTVLEVIGENNEEIADSIRDEMFTFDDLASIDKRSMQKILGSIDTMVLATSLKACSPEAEANVFNNLSKRAKEMVIDERDAKGPTPLSEVLESQKQILVTVRTMMDSGEVLAPGGAGEQLV